MCPDYFVTYVSGLDPHETGIVFQINGLALHRDTKRDRSVRTHHWRALWDGLMEQQLTAGAGVISLNTPLFYYFGHKTAAVYYRLLGSDYFGELVTGRKLIAPVAGFDIRYLPPTSTENHNRAIQEEPLPGQGVDWQLGYFYGLRLLTAYSRLTDEDLDHSFSDPELRPFISPKVQFENIDRMMALEPHELVQSLISSYRIYGSYQRSRKDMFNYGFEGVFHEASFKVAPLGRIVYRLSISSNRIHRDIALQVLTALVHDRDVHNQLVSDFLIITYLTNIAERGDRDEIRGVIATLSKLTHVQDTFQVLWKLKAYADEEDFGVSPPPLDQQMDARLEHLQKTWKESQARESKLVEELLAYLATGDSTFFTHLEQPDVLEQFRSSWRDIVGAALLLRTKVPGTLSTGD